MNRLATHEAAPSLISLVNDPADGDSRPMLLLLPGLSGNNHQWDLVAAAFAGSDVSLALGAPILAHPAFNGSRPTVRELARAMAVELRTRPPASVVVVSHSVGAFVALALAHEAPAAVKAVVAINGGLTMVAKFIDAPLALLVRHPREALGFVRLFALVAAPVPQKIKRAIASNRRATSMVLGDLVSKAGIESEEQRRSLIAEAGRFETLYALNDNRHHWREFVTYAREIQLPVVFVVGDHDPMTSVEDTETMAAMLPQASVEVLEGIGHAAPIEASAAVVELIRAQLSAVR
jgi:pimeloyl-ACP methyl ester carboxylesterase